MLFGRSKSKEQEKTPVEADSDNQLYIHVRESGWDAAVVSDGEVLQRVAQTGAIELDVPRAERLAKVFEDLGKSFGKPEFKDMGQIQILLDDPDFVFVESRDHQLPSPTIGAVRDFGLKNLGGSAATVAFRPYVKKPSASDEPAEGVYIISEVDRLRKNLGPLDTHALKIVSIVPVGDLLLDRLSREPGQGHAALYLGDFTSLFAISNWEEKVVILRKIPVGIMSLVQKVATDIGASINETKTAISDRDYISDQLGNRAVSAGTVQVGTAQGRALVELLGDLTRPLKETIEFFETQHMGGEVQKIDCFGKISTIRGLSEYISNELGPVSDDVVEDLVPDFVSGDTQIRMNLLKGADQPIVTVQKIAYRYVEDKFVSEKDFVAARKEASKTEVDPGAARNRGGRRRRGRSPGGGNEKSTRISVSEWLAKFRGKKSEETPATFATDDGEEQNERVYFLAIVAVALGVLYAAWQPYDSITKTHSFAVSNFFSDIVQNRQFRDRIFANRSFTSAIPLESDKVLWSEKILSLASNMSEAMWITDVYLSDETRKLGGNEVIAKKLTIEGAVLPSTDGHIERISEYIDRLLQDDHYFMSDFREITFEGASIDQEEQDHVIRFAIDAWYDENKRVEKSTEAKSEKSGSPIDQMQRQVGDRNKEATDSLQGNINN